MHHERLMRYVAKRPKLVKVLKVYCHLTSSVAVAAFALLFRFYLNISPLSAVKYLGMLGIPFVLVSLMRRYIGAPRPYEVYDFFENRPKDSEKNSFPSRHAFSIFAIGVATWFVYPVFGRMSNGVLILDSDEHNIFAKCNIRSSAPDRENGTVINEMKTYE